MSGYPGGYPTQGGGYPGSAPPASGGYPGNCQFLNIPEFHSDSALKLGRRFEDTWFSTESLKGRTIISKCLQAPLTVIYCLQ